MRRNWSQPRWRTKCIIGTDVWRVACLTAERPTVPDLEDLGCFVIGGIAIVVILLLAACVIGLILVASIFT